MKKILVLYGHNYPDGLAMANRLHLYSKSILLNKDVKFKIGVVRKKNSDSPGQVGDLNLHENVPYFYLLPPIPSSNPIYIRLYRLFDILKVLFHIYSQRKDIDTLWCISFRSRDLFLISTLTKLFKIRLIIEVNEKPYSYKGGRLSFTWLNSLKSFIVPKTVYKMIDGFVVISENLKDYLSTSRIGKDKIIKIPILIQSKLDVERLVPEKPFVLHAGTLDVQKDGIIEIFEAIALARKKSGIDFDFVLTRKSGDPIILEKINDIIEVNKMRSNIIFHNYLSRPALDLLMESCSMAIVNRGDNKQNRYNFSTKLGDYMSFGIPVLSTDTGEAKNYLIHRENCLIIKQGDIEDIADMVIEILSDSAFAARIGKSGQETAKKHFEYSKYGSILTNFLTRN